jgi:hypothetical protein
MLKRHEKKFECLGVLPSQGKILKQYPELKRCIQETIIPIEESTGKIRDLVPNEFVRQCFLDILFEVCRWLLPLNGYYDKSRINCLSELRDLNDLPDIQSRYDSIRASHSTLRNAVILGNMNSNARARFTYSKGGGRIAEAMYDFLVREFK